VCRVGVGPCAGGGPLLPSVIGGRAFVVHGAGSCRVPSSLTRVASVPLPAPPSATAAGRGSSADKIAGAPTDRPPTLRLSARPCLTSLGTGEGLMAAASALRSSLLLFGPPEQKSSSSPLQERATASRSSVLYCSAGPPIVWGCSYLRRWNWSSVCNGTLNAGLLFIVAVGA
jgi:hypothetical protein